jgi:uncharacterized protein YvpB
MLFIATGFVFVKTKRQEDPEQVRKETVSDIVKLAKESPKIDFVPAAKASTNPAEILGGGRIPDNNPIKPTSVTDQVLKTLVPEKTPDLSLFDVVTLDVPADKQEFRNSCEESALQMVLAYYDIQATEMEIVKKVGYNPRVWDKAKGIWDDPYEMFVGAINEPSGYGTYAPAIAKAARAFERNAQSYSPITPNFIAEQIYKGYPVIVWGFFKTPPYTKYSWKTDTGKEIEGYRGEHARVVVGVVGDKDNPTGFFLNDPRTGEAKVYWSSERLMEHMNIWGNLTNQAVVVQ